MRAVLLVFLLLTAKWIAEVDLLRQPLGKEGSAAIRPRFQFNVRFGDYASVKQDD